jgi:hypothetical protein
MPVWKTPRELLAVEVPLATLSATQLAQFEAAAAVAWQPVQSGSPVNVWFIWFFTVLWIDV